MKKAVLDYAIRTKLPVVVFVVACSFALTFFISRAERVSVGYSPVQPIPFSHKLHAGEMGIDCQYCHSSAPASRHAEVPPLSTCMNCHSIARKDKPDIKRFTGYFEKGIAVSWKRVHRLPDFTYFNHSVHVNNGIKCSRCHGPVESMDGAVQVSEFTMGACLDCHRNAQELLTDVPGIQKGPDNCWACHR
jgi:hypothetical protein